MNYAIQNIFHSMHAECKSPQLVSDKVDVRISFQSNLVSILRKDPLRLIVMAQRTVYISTCSVKVKPYKTKRWKRSQVCFCPVFL